MYQLYYYPNNASLAPHFLLQHMGLAYELILVDKKSHAQKSPDYLRLNPAGRIPTLIASGQPIFESAAICIHLCEQHPEHALIPPLGSPERPQFFQWLAYLNNTLQTELMIYYYPHRHTTDAAAMPQIRAAQGERIREALALLDERLTARRYLLGDELSGCDFFCWMLAEWCLPLPHSPLEFPALRSYLQHLSQLPAIQAVCQIEAIDLTPFVTHRSVTE